MASNIVTSGAAGVQPAASSPIDPILDVDGVTIQYKTKEHLITATYRVSFQVFQADRFVILGPSGCGKSTLLKSVAGYIHPVEGEMRLKGNVVRDPGPDRVMVFQEFDQLLPWKTVKENITFALTNGGKTSSASEANDIAMEYIQKVKLERFENTYPHMLSGGMKQRVAIARGMAMEPDILLMDEPFAAVDAQTREILQFELLKIWGMRPMTMVFVTHSIEEAVLMGDRVVVLKGRPSSVFEVIDVDLPAPRDRSTLSHPRFAEYREHVWNTLMDEVRAAEFELN